MCHHARPTPTHHHPRKLPITLPSLFRLFPSMFLCLLNMIALQRYLTADGSFIDYVCHGSDKYARHVVIGDTIADTAKLVCSEGKFKLEDGIEVTSVQVQQMTCSRKNEPKIMRNAIGNKCFKKVKVKSEKA
jgi:hypothetical protein